MKKTALFLLMAGLLSACAITPEQRAEREHQQKLYEQQLQVNLAAQCDTATAQVMQQQFQQPIHWSAEEKKAFQLKYIEKMADPMFQSCYKMAWQNYVSQQRLRQMRDWYEWHDGWYRSPFFGRPYWW